MNMFPAILVGGPPHSGKSVLCYSLSQSLRERGLAHYLLRAAPDGEGDWANEIRPGLLKDIRVKHDWTPYWVNVTRRDVARRTLPLLVDMGGRPTPEQETIFDQCTHAVILAAEDAARQEWRSRARSHSLIVLADLRSALAGELFVDAPAQESPEIGPLTGVLTGLARGSRAGGQVYELLVARIAELLRPYDQGAIQRAHFASAPFRMAPAVAPEDGGVTVIDLQELAIRLHPDSPSARFDAQSDVEAVLARVPADRPIALYGRPLAPMVTAIAAHCDVRWQFDARLGWVQPLRLPVRRPGDDAHDLAGCVTWTLVPAPDGGKRVTLKASLRDGYLDYEEARELVLPYIAPEQYVTIDAKIPFWLLSSLALAYQYCAGVTVRYVASI